MLQIARAWNYVRRDLPSFTAQVPLERADQRASRKLLSDQKRETREVLSIRHTPRPTNRQQADDQRSPSNQPGQRN
jgi:hypothetical protein